MSIFREGQVYKPGLPQEESGEEVGHSDHHSDRSAEFMDFPRDGLEEARGSEEIIAEVPRAGGLERDGHQFCSTSNTHSGHDGKFIRQRPRCRRHLHSCLHGRRSHTRSTAATDCSVRPKTQLLAPKSARNLRRPDPIPQSLRPPHRYTPLKKAWLEIYTPIYEEMKIDIRMNLKARRVELKTRADTPDVSNLQKCADFVHAFMLGFDIIDVVALFRMDELYIESFEIKDVKTLRGEHLSRAIGRLSGKGGKTKFAIENATRMRIVIADTKIHILGSFANIKVARDSLCSLILGSPAAKVYLKLRAVSARLAERF
ncbi:hypothetical protein DH2020_001868 [Rehmannia glutinosa]|uniref:K Homology domain-containing protein n=1 Tax=Rehmannia glutinosa TaxID=99300 RepID=A0ABR0XS45_REHGL